MPWLAVVGLALPAGAALLVASVARRPVAPPGVLGALPRLEAEVEAAQGDGLYLVLDPAGRALAVRARGKTLDTVPLQALRVDLHRPPGRSGEAHAIGLWTVEVEPEGNYRRVIAPAELRPYQEAGEIEAPVASAPPEVLPDPPASYAVGLADGWQILVVQEPPADTSWSRFGQALDEGWARLRRRPRARPDRLVLVVTAEQGSRLHHLFRKGTPVVLAREPLAAPPAATDGQQLTPGRDEDAPAGARVERPRAAAEPG